MLTLAYTARLLTPGVTYKFKIQARNEFGLSVYSNEISLLCAFIPAVPAAPTTSVIANNMIVQWVAPASNGSPITSYRVKLQQKSGAYSEELTKCNSESSVLVTDLKCTIPLLTLQATPFLLELGDSIYATVSATNVYGESSASSEGNGATLLTVPDRPVGLSTDVATNTK